ncbi:hypothetical protein MH144_11815 [Paenibacillus sp. ACRRY]|nr:hypothetical protein [Paenibacillus sp. ACRRY]
MSNRKLTKFPVIAADGTQYRVTIKRGEDVDGKYVFVRLFVRRKIFGFAGVAHGKFYDGYGVYKADYPDYISIARKVCGDFTDDILPRIQRKSAAIDAFQAWDGRL